MDLMQVIEVLAPALFMGVGIYTAIRVDLAVMKKQMEFHARDVERVRDDISDVHERVDRLQRSRMETL